MLDKRGAHSQVCSCYILEVINPWLIISKSDDLLLLDFLETD